MVPISNTRVQEQHLVRGLGPRVESGVLSDCSELGTACLPVEAQGEISKVWAFSYMYVFNFKTWRDRLPWYMFLVQRIRALDH